MCGLGEVNDQVVMPSGDTRGLHSVGPSDRRLFGVDSYSSSCIVGGQE